MGSMSTCSRVLLTVALLASALVSALAVSPATADAHPCGHGNVSIASDFVANTSPPGCPPINAVHAPIYDTLLQHGEPWCVVDVPDWDHLNVRTGPSTRFDIVGRLAPDSCTVRIDPNAPSYHVQGNWMKVTAFMGVGEELHVSEGWVSLSYLRPLSAVNLPAAAALRGEKTSTQGLVPSIFGPTAEPHNTDSCEQQDSGAYRCLLSGWYWVPGTSPCNNYGYGRYQRHVVGSATVYFADNRWIAVEDPFLALQC